jgi:hypothetical protein
MSVGIIFTSISPSDVGAKRDERDHYSRVIYEKYEELVTFALTGDVASMDRLRKEIVFLKVAVSELSFLLENCGR